MTKPSSLRKRMSENAEPLTEGAQSQTASVLAALIEQHCHLSLGNYICGNFLEFGLWIEGQEWYELDP